MLHLNNMYYGIQKDYFNKNTLAYNMIIIPNLECLYETKFKTVFKLPKNISGTFKELRHFCKDKQIFLVVINIVSSIITQDHNMKKLLKQTAEQSTHYTIFLEYLKQLENKVKYNFNMLIWLDDLNNETLLNKFCSQTWDTLC